MSVAELTTTDLTPNKKAPTMETALVKASLNL